MGHREPFSWGAGRVGRQQARDKPRKEKGVGKKDLLLFLSQEPLSPRSNWSSGFWEEQCRWVACKASPLPNIPNELTHLY